MDDGSAPERDDDDDDDDGGSLSTASLLPAVPVWERGSPAGPAASRDSSGYFAKHAAPSFKRGSGIALAYVLCGAGMLVPFNSFVAGGDFFKAAFPSNNPLFDMPLLYTYVTGAAVTVTVVWGMGAHAHMRVRVGFAFFFASLLLVRAWLMIASAKTIITPNTHRRRRARRLRSGLRTRRRQGWLTAPFCWPLC